jgi:hypothetical protein
MRALHGHVQGSFCRGGCRSSGGLSCSRGGAKQTLSCDALCRGARRTLASPGFAPRAASLVTLTAAVWVTWQVAFKIDPVLSTTAGEHSALLFRQWQMGSIVLHGQWRRQCLTKGGSLRLDRRTPWLYISITCVYLMTGRVTASRRYSSSLHPVQTMRISCLPLVNTL